MAVQGETYASVDANALDFGVSPMNISGVTPGYGDTTFVQVGLAWTYDQADGSGGFTGTGWYWNDNHNILSSSGNWNSEDEFKQWLMQGDQTDALNNLFSQWDTKANFIINNQRSLGVGGCMEEA